MEELEATTIDETIDFNSDMESYFNEDSYKAFWKSIKSYPILSSEENRILAVEAQSGNEIAREKLIKSNLRLVAWVANKYKNRINHMQILDIIQEGSIGLMRSIETYNPEKGAFTTYAINWIRQAITRSISNNEDDIRLPVYLESKINTYLKILEVCKENKRPIPSDPELCEILDVSLEILFNIKNYNYNPLSINQKINEDDGDTELENFIIAEDNSYDEVLERLSNNDLFAVLKEVLNHKEYYVIYYRYLIEEKKTLEELSQDLGISRERVRQIETKSLRKIKPYMVPDSNHYRKKVSKLNELGQSLNWYNITPINVNQIIMFLYIKDELTDIEKQVMYFDVFGKMKSEWYRVKLGLSINEYTEIKKSIEEKMKKVKLNKKHFLSFKTNTIKNNGAKIFDYTLEGFKLIDYDYLKSQYDNLTYEEIINLLNENNVKTSEKDIAGLKKYFEIPQKRYVKKQYIEKEIYLLLFNCKKLSTRISPKKLYKIFIANIQEFDEEQILVLECFYFNTKKKTEFMEKYPDSLLYKYFQFLIDKLEKMYYGLNDMFENSFNKEKYIFVKKNYSKRLTDERIKLLDLFYGLNGRVYSIKEISIMLNEDYIKIHDKISNARNYCIRLYNKRSGTLNIDLDIYKSFIDRKEILLTEETRNILRLYIIEGLDYPKISEITGLSKYRISNIITDGIRKLDFYRFNIIEIEQVSKKDLEGFFEVYDKNFTELEKRIVYLKRVEIFDNDKIAELVRIPKNEVNLIISKFNRLYLKYQIRDTSLNKEDILEEINSHISESVIDEFSKEILSLYYGIKTIYNKDGLCLTSDEIKQKYKLTKDKFYKKFYYAQDLIKAKKLGLVKNDLVYIGREELEVLLKDLYLPISDKEREIICCLFGLNNYPYKTLEDLSIIYGDTKGSIKRRYQRAIVNICKYQNKEIEGIFNYETDILPKLKFFSKSDTLIIEEYYKNGLTYKELSEKYGFTFDQVVGVLNRIKNSLIDYINDSEKNGFDFEFYRREKNNPKLPFYGNRKLAEKVFELFMGENSVKQLSIPEIINELKLENCQTTINSMITNYMISFCKLKDGITKVGFSYEEILEYYNNNFASMNEEHRQIYLNYFKRKNNKKIVNETTNNVNEMIIYDLLRFYYPDYFSLNNANYEDIFKILKTYYYQMNDSTREYLMYEFNISGRKLMNGKEINHVFRILDRLDSTRKMNKKSSMLLTRKKIES